MKETKVVRIAGNKKWADLNHKNIRDIQVDFQMVSYNPIRQNPNMIAETLLQILPFLAENPDVNMRDLTEEVIRGMGLPQRVLLPEEDVIAMQQEAMMAQQQAALGGAAAGAPALEAAQEQGAMPPGPPAEPEITPEQAFAAGGGSPIRDGAPEA